MAPPDRRWQRPVMAALDVGSGPARRRPEAVAERAIVDQHSDLAHAAAQAYTVTDLGGVLRLLRSRHGLQHPSGPLTYRELAARMGSSHGIIGEYLAGHVLPPTERFDALVALLGASSIERGLLATARDEVEEHRRRSRVAEPSAARYGQICADA